MARMSLPRARSLPAALAVLLLAAGLVVGPAPLPATAAERAQGTASTEAFRTGRLVVRYRAGTSAAARREVRRVTGTARRTGLRRLDVEVLTAASPQRALAQLLARREVLWAEPEVFAQRLAEVTSTPERRELALDEARTTDPRFDGAGVNVAVIDDGVYPVADLVGRLVDRGDCSGDVCLATGGVNNLADPGFGSHGTAVAAIIAAGRGNDVGIVGAAPQATIWSYRVFPDITAGASDISIANAIMAAADDGADVANLSLGTPFDSRLLRDAVAYARRVRPDMVIVSASGNDSGARPSYPAGSATVLSVGASEPGADGTWRVARFSTRGDVDVVAPGEGIRTWFTPANADNPTGLGAPTGTTLVEGSSFAAPAVTGIVAGLAGVGIRGDRARAAVVAAAEPAPPVDGVPLAASGAGRADALTSLRLATGTSPYSAGFVDQGAFVARSVGTRRIETLRFDPAPTSGANGPAPVVVESGGGELSAAQADPPRVLAGGHLLRATHTYRAVDTTADEVRLAVGAAGDEGSTVALRIVDATAGPEGVPAPSGAAVDVDLTFELNASYVRTVPLTAGQLLAIDFRLAPDAPDAVPVVWAPNSTGGVARASDAPHAFEPTGAASGVWVYVAPRTGTYAFGLVAFSGAGDGRHRIGAQYPVAPQVTAPARVLTVGSPAVVPISWGLFVGSDPVPTQAGSVRWDVALQTVSRGRDGRVLLGPLRVVAADTDASGMRLTVASVGRYRVQVRPATADGPTLAWSPVKEFLVLPLRRVGAAAPPR